ncbi:MAG: hypothetical protein RIC35_21070 [Marinoscillum sp.]
MKKVFVLGIAILSVFSVHAQTDSLKATHYFGIQANQLVRQLLNFGGSSPTVQNPYLVSYSFNKENGWGMGVGLGSRLNHFEDGDEFANQETKINEFFLRIGVDNKTDLGKNWLLGWGIDVVFEATKNETTSKNDFNGSSQETYTRNKVTGFGFGPRLNLFYSFGEHLGLGTEASYYYKHQNVNNIIESKSSGGGGSFSNEEEFDRSNNSFQLILPSVIYLTFRF